MLINIVGPQETHRVNALEVSPDETVNSLRQRIATRIGVQNPQTIRIVYCGRLLRDDHNLSEYNICDGCTAHIVVRDPEVRNEENAPQSNETSGNVPPPVFTIPIEGNNVALSSLASIIGSIVTQQFQSAQAGNTSQTNRSRINPLFQSGINLFSTVLSNQSSNNNNNNNTRQNAARSSQAQQGRSSPTTQASSEITTEDTESTCSEADPARTVEGTTPAGTARLSIRRVQLHIHCNLEEMDQLPASLERLVQRLHQIQGLQVGTSPALRVHPSVSYEQRPRRRTRSSPPAGRPSFLKYLLEWLAANIDMMNVLSAACGDFRMFERKREEIRQKLNEYLTQYDAASENPESTQQSSRSCLENVANFEGETWIPVLMGYRPIQEILTEYNCTDAQRAHIILELKNSFKYFVYKLLKAFQAVEPTENALWLKNVIKILQESMGMITKRAQEEWFQGQPEASTVVKRILSTLLKHLFELMESNTSTMIPSAMASQFIDLICSRLGNLAESYPQSHCADEIFTNWRNAISKEENDSDAILDDLVSEVLNEQEEQESDPFNRMVCAVTEWGRLSTSHSEAAERVLELLTQFRERLTVSTTAPDGNGENTNHSPEAFSPLWNEFLSEHQ